MSYLLSLLLELYCTALKEMQIIKYLLIKGCWLLWYSAMERNILFYEKYVSNSSQFEFAFVIVSSSMRPHGDGLLIIYLVWH